MYFFCFKQKTAYEMRISDWSSGVCSSYLFGERMVKPRPSIDDPQHRLGTEQAGGQPGDNKHHGARIEQQGEQQRPYQLHQMSSHTDRRTATRRVGKERVVRCRYRWSPSQKKKRKHTTT